MGLHRSREKIGGDLAVRGLGIVALSCAAALAGCQATDMGLGGADAADAPKPNVCHADAALSDQRDLCAFESGALPVQTIGDCTGDKIPIEHVILIVQENRSFDQYFGHLPGNGQDDLDVPSADTANPAANGAAAIPWHHETSYCVEDTDHGWVASHGQWNGGTNDGFAKTNATQLDASGQRAMGWYDKSDLPFYYDLVSRFATSDRYFCSVLGPTYPNRMYLYGGTSFGLVNTNASSLAPPGAPNIFRTFQDSGISWKVYKSDLPGNGVFLDFVTDPALADHFVSVDQFSIDAAAGTLPQVSVVDGIYEGKAWLETDEHPPADAQLGQHFVYQQVAALTASPLWSSSALFITYDEHGGIYDHVSPPAACAPDDTPPKFNPELGGFDRLGFRVPLVVVSPWVKRHYVSHVVHSHTSILRFLEAKFDLPALTKRDANSDAMLDLFDFDAAPRLDVPAFAEPPVDDAQIEACKTNFPN
jgi:phospholipase C